MSNFVDCLKSDPKLIENLAVSLELNAVELYQGSRHYLDFILYWILHAEDKFWRYFLQLSLIKGLHISLFHLLLHSPVQWYWLICLHESDINVTQSLL